MMGSIPEVTLISSAGEKKIPVVGFGTAIFPLGSDDEAVKLAVLEGIKLGYRHFDTAAAYKSEQPLGETIAEAIDLGLIKSRDELFITSKLWCGSTERNLVVPSLKTSLQNLQLDYLDLYLIHWPLRFSTDVFQTPVPKEQLLPFDTKSVWEAMEECQNLGLTKSIGVSNFSCKKLTELLSTAKITPAVNQVEMNTSWQQTKLREFCKGKGIHITGYSPLGAHGTIWGDNRVVENQVLEEIGKPRVKTAAQVCLRWIYEQGASMVVKSFNKDRMKANLDIFDWELDEEELKKISQLPQRKAVLPTAAFGDHDEVRELDYEI